MPIETPIYLFEHQFRAGSLLQEIVEKIWVLLEGCFAKGRNMCFISILLVKHKNRRIKSNVTYRESVTALLKSVTAQRYLQRGPQVRRFGTSCCLTRALMSPGLPGQAVLETSENDDNHER